MMVMTVVFAVISCSHQAQLIKEASAPTPPAWVTGPPGDSRDLRFFVGIRTGASTREEGIDSAVKDASGQIAGFLKSRVRTEFEETTTQVEQNLKQQITARSAVVVRGAKVVDWYHVKTSRIDREFRTERYDVYVLVTYPKEEMGREMKRQADERRAVAGNALGWYRKGEREEEGKRYSDAMGSYLTAIKELTSLDEAMPVEGGFVDSAGLLRAAREKSDEMTRRSRRLALRCRVRGDDDSYKQFVSGFSAVLISGKIEVNDDDPAYELTGEVSVAEGGNIMGNHLAYVTGTLEMRRTVDGRIVTVIPLQLKGFHRNRDIAALNALQEVGGQAGEAVLKAIMANEPIP
jgi:hypothetical protein